MRYILSCAVVGIRPQLVLIVVVRHFLSGTLFSGRFPLACVFVYVCVHVCVCASVQRRLLSKWRLF